MKFVNDKISDMKNIIPNTILGSNLNRYIKAAKLDRKRFAELTGCSPGQIKKYETGENQPSIIKAQTFAKVLNISLGDLVSETPIVKNTSSDNHDDRLAVIQKVWGLLPPSIQDAIFGMIEACSKQHGLSLEIKGAEKKNSQEKKSA
jgi:transcriptional regulator with XRE-family HTH domain